jgi:membrane protease YdiL (CAAX protease family)
MDGNKFFVSIIILAVAAANNYLKYFYAYLIFGQERYRSMSSDVRNLMIQGTTVLICLALTLAFNSFSFRRTFSMLGIRKNMLLPIAIAFVCTLPMFLGAYFTSSFNNDMTVSGIFMSTVWAGITEEFIYRAFITGLLVRVARWPFLPAALISSFFFGYGHLYQAQDFSEAVMVLSFTVGAGIGFSIFYKMWNWNLWFVAALHVFMNLSFALFDTGDNVLLSFSGNIFRGITIVLAIIASVIYQRRRRQQANSEVPLVVNTLP